jgi:hypothetical protein
MELLDQYLKSVRSCLPEEQKDDIVNELSENIHSQIEDKEAGLGRPLNETEVEAILKQHGHPLLVASRYRQDQRSVAFGRQWIGPVLFPFYVRVLCFNLGLTGIIVLSIFTAMIASGHSVAPWEVFPALLYQFLIQFAVITVIFACADRHWTKFPDRWDPRGLKHPWHPAFAMQTGSNPEIGSTSKMDAPQVSRFDSVAQFVALGISIGWLRVVQSNPFMIFGPAAAFVKAAPVWHQFYWPVVALALAGMLQAGINVLRPDWVRLHSAFRAAGYAGWIVILSFLLKAHVWVVLAGTQGPSADGYRRTVDILNQCFYYTLIGLMVVAACTLLRNIHKLIRGTQPGAAVRTTSKS